MRILTLLAVVVTCIWPASSRGQDLQAFNMFDAAKKVSDIAMQIAPNEQSFFVREFRGLASNNIGLSKLIGDQLTSAGRKIAPGTGPEIEGRLLRLPRDESKDLTGFTIQGVVYLTNGAARRFSVDVLNRDDGITTVGDTGETAAPPTAEKFTPPVVEPSIVGTECRPSPESPFGVEVLVETSPGQYQPCTPRLDGNLLRIDMSQGNIYAVRVSNRTDHDAAVEVLIDGLSRFALADNPALTNGRDLVDRQSSRIIKGYFRNESVVDAFQIGEHSKSVAATTLPNPTDIGTITVSFAAAWEDHQKPPPNEPPVAKAASPLGTIRGPERADPTVSVKRFIGGIRAIVKIRY